MRRLFFAVLMGLWTAFLAPGVAMATPAVEAPWVPEAAAYRLTLFMGNMTPIDWDGLTRVWEEPIAAAAGSAVALTKFAPQDAAAVRAALAAKDRQALFEAGTAGLARMIVNNLAAAQEALGIPPALVALRQAQAEFRAFEGAIVIAEPEQMRVLGLAWLEMVTGVGSAGVLGAGGVDPDREAFAAARAVVEDYLRANYLVAEFAPRPILTALPESVVASGRAVVLPAVLPPGANIFDQNPLPRLVLSFEEEGTDEADLPLVAFGDMLFDSPQIFGGPAREIGLACSVCHNRSDINRDFFIPGISARPGGLDVDSAFFNPMFNDRRADHVDTPSLRGIRFTAPYGRDGREPSLRSFTRNVIVTEFAGAEPTPFMLDALVAYMREFEFLPNPKIDGSGVLTDLASDAARRGEILFNSPFAGLNGKSCAACHNPLTKFRDGQTYDIGSVPPPFEDATPRMMETPTLLSVRFSNPYFGDGSLPTLDSVVRWFNDTKALGLDEAQINDLTAYLEAVGDGEEPYELFDDSFTPFRLTFEELTVFASTLNTLLPMRDQANIALLVDTVAFDMVRDAALMRNLVAKPDVYRLAELLRLVGDASAAGDWEGAQTKWGEFQTLQVEIDEEVY